MTKHRHKFTIASYSLNRIQFRCSCGDKIERESTKAERKLLGYNKLTLTPPKPKYGEDIHFVYHDYVKKFVSEKAKKYETKYELMSAVETWAAKYPKDVKVVRIDDSFHAGSRLFLIDHRTKNKYFGITAVVITQCDNQPAPFEFFLYPDHQSDLLTKLSGLFANSKAIIAKTEKNQKEGYAKLNKLIRP